MSWPWASPEATRSGISQRLRVRHPPAEIQLRQYEVAFRRLLARLEAAAPGRWVIKGGVALLLRLDPSRTSNDMDVAYRTDEGALAAALDALQQAFAVEMKDFFSFRMAQVAGEERLDGDRTLPLRVEAMIGGRLWVTFGVDLGFTDESLPTDPVIAREARRGRPFAAAAGPNDPAPDRPEGLRVLRDPRGSPEALDARPRLDRCGD